MRRSATLERIDQPVENASYFCDVLEQSRIFLFIKKAQVPGNH